LPVWGMVGYYATGAWAGGLLCSERWMSMGGQALCGIRCIMFTESMPTQAWARHPWPRTRMAIGKGLWPPTNEDTLW
jgi:hypothetical protein